MDFGMQVEDACCRRMGVEIPNSVGGHPLASLPAIRHGTGWAQELVGQVDWPVFPEMVDIIPKGGQEIVTQFQLEPEITVSCKVIELVQLLVIKPTPTVMFIVRPKLP